MAKPVLVDADGFAVTKKQRQALSLETLPHSIKPIQYFDWVSLAALPTGSKFIFDIESYVNYFLIAFKHIDSGRVVCIEDSPDVELNRDLLAWMIHRFLLIGFNSNTFDMPLVACALHKGMNCEQLKEIVNRMIPGPGMIGEKATDILRELDTWVPTCNHIDLIEIPPANGSLKKFAAMLHCKKMQELPYDPYEVLTKEMAEAVKLYCVNDLDNTQLIYEALSVEIKLREHLGKQYNLDLRSKSDPQMAEAVLRTEVAKITGKYAKPTRVEAGTRFRYDPPAFLQFQTPLMQKALHQIRLMDFEVSETGYVVVEELAKLQLPIGEQVYQMGKGGLHSKEKTVSYHSNDEFKIIDNDVASYYPRLILNTGLYPENLGPAFLTVYEQLIVSRIADKKAKNYSDAESKKVTINGTFGKLGNRYSLVYAPKLLIQVTLTGQLALLMLIEAFELVGIKVISANTDGVVCYVHSSQYQLMKQIIKDWEARTKLEMEESRYLSLYSRDINNYIAVKEPDEKGAVKVKGKGAYFDPRYEIDKTSVYRFKKNPENTICLDAIYALIVDGVPIEKTIRECRDITKFVTVRTVNGGAYKMGYYLGKVVRWYYAKGVTGTINYITSGNKVPNSEGACPLLELPDEFPNDIDYARYESITRTMLENIDYLKASRIKGLFD